MLIFVIKISEFADCGVEGVSEINQVSREGIEKATSILLIKYSLLT